MIFVLIISSLSANSTESPVKLKGAPVAEVHGKNFCTEKPPFQVVATRAPKVAKPQVINVKLLGFLISPQTDLPLSTFACFD